MSAPDIILKNVGEEKDAELEKVLDAKEYETYAKNKEAMKEKNTGQGKRKEEQLNIYLLTIEI